MTTLSNAPVAADILYVRGSQQAILFTVTDADTGAAINLTGAHVQLFIKASHTTPNSMALKTYDTADGSMTVTDGPNGKVQVNCLASDFASTDLTVGFPSGYAREYSLWSVTASKPMAAGSWTVVDV